jgi:hypothetical protein
MAGTSGAKTALRAFCPAMTLFCCARTATDILNLERYINPARHVRAFGVGLDQLK